MRSIFLSTLVLFLSGTLGLFAENRVLFIGNSFIQGTGGARASVVGGVPGIFDRLAQAGGQENPTTVMRAVGGMDFEFHASHADTDAAIRSDQWTHVILQNYSTEPTHVDASHPLEDHFTFGKALYNKVIENHEGTEVILYETFSRAWNHALISGTSTASTFSSTAEFQSELRTNYQALADQINAEYPANPPVKVAPVGSAWEHAGGLRKASEAGYVDLHGDDNYHGNDNGYYLAAAVFYATIYADSPVGLSKSPLVAGMNLQLTVDAAVLETAAWETVGGGSVAQLSEGESIWLDFGADASSSSDPWNNVTPAVGGTDNGELLDLMTAEGAPSGVNFAMLRRFNGANTNGASGTGIYPDTVTQDSLFGNTEAFGGLMDVFPSFKFTGLEPTATYAFTFYAARLGVGDSRETLYTLDGASTDTVAFEPANNETESASIGGIRPNAAGEISISLSPTENNTNGSHFTYLGALVVTAGEGAMGGGDQLAPRLETASTNDGTTITLTFSESLEVTSAHASANYVVTDADGNAVTVSAVELQADGRTLFLLVERALVGPFTVAVENVADLAGNAVAPGTSVAGVAPDPNTTVVFIDFGGSATVFEDPTGRQWNTVDQGIGGTDDGLLAGIVDSKGSETSIELQMLSRFNGTNTNGTQESTLFDLGATGDSLFGNTELFSNLENIFPRFKFTGLDPSLAYNFLFYASRMGVGDSRETAYTLEGTADTTVVLDPANNIDSFIEANSIAPTAEGEITISLAPSENNTNGNHFTYLGVLQMSTVPQTATVSFLEHPKDVTVTEFEPAQFSANALGEPPLTVQWFRNGEAIDGATELTYQIAETPLAWNGSSLTVSVGNATSTVTSKPATLTVRADILAPQVLSVGSSNGKTLVLNFSEPVDPTQAVNVANFTVNEGLPIESVALGADNTSLLITLAEAVVGPFTIFTENLTDRVGNAFVSNTFEGNAPDPDFPSFLFDFGSPNTNQGVEDPFLHWNNVTGAIGSTDDGVLETIVSTQGLDSGIQLVMLSRFNGTNTAGSTASGLFPATASSDSLFGNTEDFSGLSDIFPSFKLTGLDPSRSYTFTMYASRLNTGGDSRETGYTIAGSTIGFAALEPAENVDATAVVEGIVPDAAGEISISLEPTENNTNANHFTYLGVLKIDTEPGKSFEITEVRALSDDSVSLTWDAEPGEFFVIQHSPSLQVGSWETLGDMIPAEAAPATSLTRSVMRLADEQAHYYRIAKVPPPALLEQRFENGLGEWVIETNGITAGTTWEIGVPAAPPGASEGTQVAATGLADAFADGLFNNGLGIALRSPVVDLSGKRAALLSFSHFVDVNDGQSGGQLKILRADDLTPLDVGGPLLFVENTPEWTDYTLRLPSTVLEAGRIIVEFEFISALDDDPTNNGLGWLIDNVRLD